MNAIVSTTLEGLLWTYAAAGLVLVHALAAVRRDRTLLVTLLTLDGVATFLGTAALLDPSLFRRWMQEDRWVEWATVFAFLLAAVMALRAARRVSASTGAVALQRLAFVAVALFCLFVAGEEISWGQRLFGFQPPEIFLERNYQQELNLHNFLKDEQTLGFKLDSRYLVALVALLYGVLFPWLARRGRAERSPAWLRALCAPAPAIALSPWFAAVALVELTYPVKLTGEAAELGLGLLFLVNGVLEASPEPRAVTVVGPRLLGAIALVGALGMLTPPLVQRLLHGADSAVVAQISSELAALRRDLQRPGAIRPRIFRKRRVHKRLFTAVRAGYLRFDADSAFLEGKRTPAQRGAGAERRDRRGYFLDPWHNPYWIHKDRAGWITLYSFGPNRRRDGRIRRLRPGATLSGDDIAHRFRLPRRPKRAIRAVP